MCRHTPLTFPTHSLYFFNQIILDKIFVRIKNNRLLCSTLLKMDGGSQVTMFSMVGILLVVGVVDVYLIKEEYE